ncbi:MAG: DUF493 domain-containing protein [Bdellovibrionaceae bacterium]|nr:DUF493 domain-containing protein [Pseudobdellovibrionaceae bacterium]
MKGFPSVELLKSTHAFPCVFTFKVIGGAEHGFMVRVLKATRDALEINVDPEYKYRQTSHGEHLAITIEAYVETPEKVLDVYHALSKVEGVIFLM